MDHTEPLVSIVVTAYNDASTVAEALDSALDQDWPNTEVLVVLDGPTDATPEVVAPFEQRGVRVISKPNGGTASARNRGRAEAAGSWIQYLDADDVLLPSKISASLAALGRCPDPELVALIYTGYLRMDQGGRVFAEHRAEPFLRQRLLNEPGHVTTAPLVRADRLEQIGGYSEDYIYAEDTEMYHRLALSEALLAVPEPHFLYRVSETQKTRVMRDHQQGDLVLQEPRRIRRTFQQAFDEEVPPWMHPPGRLSNRGVLDLGLRCPHSCEFCYYSYSDGSDQQFRAMRRAPWRALDECHAVLDGFAAGGLTHFDITGGEPTLHPQLVQLVAHAWNQLGLRARVITLGQFLTRAKQGEATLLQRLLDAGLDDLLLSVHAVDPELFKAATGGHFERLAHTMDTLDEAGFSYCTNTLVYQRNHRHLPHIARHLAARSGARVANLIVMNTYFEWSGQGRAEMVQARYKELLPYLRQAVELLTAAGKAVNIRYGPCCAYRGLEQHFVGVLAVELDPYEWRTTLRTGQIKHYRDPQQMLQQQRALLDDPASMYGKVFGPRCQGCAMRLVCDGVDAQYIQRFGWDEFEPYPLEPGAAPVQDPLKFRVRSPQSFQLKCTDQRPQRQQRVEQLEQAAWRWEDQLELARLYRARGDASGVRRLQQTLEQRADATTAQVLLLRSLGLDNAAAQLPSARPLLEQLVRQA